MLHNAHIYFMHTLKWVKYFVFAFSNLLLLLPACYLFAKFITSGIVAYKASRKPSQQRANEFKQIPTHTNTHRQIDSLIHPPHWLHFIVTAADCCKKFELLNVCYSYHNVFCFFCTPIVLFSLLLLRFAAAPVNHCIHFVLIPFCFPETAFLTWKFSLSRWKFCNRFYASFCYFLLSVCFFCVTRLTRAFNSNLPIRNCETPLLISFGR